MPPGCRQGLAGAIPGGNAITIPGAEDGSTAVQGILPIGAVIAGDGNSPLEIQPAPVVV